MPGKERKRKEPPYFAWIDEQLRMPVLTDPQISPDGSRLAFVVAEYVEAEKKRASSIWVARTDGGGGRKFTHGPKDHSPRWSPDSQHIAFLSKRDAEHDQVYVMPADGGEARRLHDFKAACKAIAWAPSGKRLAVIVAPEQSEQDKKRKEKGDDRVLIEQEVKLDQIWLVNVDGSEAKQLTQSDFHYIQVAWSPDERLLAATMCETALEDTIMSASKLGLVDVKSGRTRVRLAWDGRVTDPAFSPDGQRIAVRLSGETYAPEGPWVLEVKGRARPLRVGGNARWDYGPPRWYPNGNDLCVLVYQGMSAAVGKLSAQATNEAQILASGFSVGTADTLSVDRACRRVGLVAESYSRPPTPSCIDLSAKPPRPKPLLDMFPGADWSFVGPARRVHWRSDQFVIEGSLYLPKDAPDRRLPLIVQVHGGPAAAVCQTFQYSGGSWLRLLCRMGYAVMTCNPRGSSNYGSAFRSANIRDWGGGDYRDIMAGVDYLIERGIADPNRLGIMGASYGGYMTAWVISQTDRFKAAVFGCGLVNLTSFYAQSDISHTFMPRYMGRRPYDDPEEYRKHSPIEFARNIRTPTLIYQGAEDKRVPNAQSQELFAALKTNGVPCEYVVYPREGHAIAEIPHRRDLMRRIAGWFERWL